MKAVFISTLSATLLILSAHVFASTPSSMASCVVPDHEINNGLNPYRKKLKTWSKSDKFGNKTVNASYSLWGDISYDTLNDIPYAAYIGSKNNAKVKVIKEFDVAKVNGEVAANMLSTTDLVMFKTKVFVVGKNI